MIAPKFKNERTLVIGPCRLSYCHVFKKNVMPGEPEERAKYSTIILIPKSEKETIEAVKKAMEAAKQEGIATKWGGKEPKKMDLALRDGDDKDDEVYAGHYFLNAKSSTRPQIVNRRGEPIVDEDEIYSGVWAYVSFSFFAYDVSGNKGIACGLNNLCKFKDDEPFGGKSSASNDFADLYDDDDL